MSEATDDAATIPAATESTVATTESTDSTVAVDADAPAPDAVVEGDAVTRWRVMWLRAG